MDAILGYGFSAIQLKQFDDALAVLKDAGNEGRYQFRKYVAWLTAYCYMATEEKKRSRCQL